MSAGHGNQGTTDHIAFSAEDEHLRERRRLVFQRLRAAAALCVVPIGLTPVLHTVMLGGPVAITEATLTVGACALAIGLTARPRYERWAIPLTVATVLGVVSFWLSGADPSRPVDDGLFRMVGSMLGAALVFPWGPAAQALVSTVVALEVVLGPVLGGADPQTHLPLFSGALLSWVASIAGAYLLDREQRRGGERRQRAWAERDRVVASARQSQMLLEVGRALNATVDLSQLTRLVTRIAQQLLVCDVVTLALVDDERRTLETVAVATGGDESADAFRGTTIAFDERLNTALSSHRVLALPDVAGHERLQKELGRWAMSRVLVAGIRRDGQLLGILSFMQRAPEPRFCDQAVRLAEGIAHQAAIALANARLIEELRSASEVKSCFVSTMSHELRTPINVILGLAEMARDDDVPQTDRRHCLARIDRAGRDLLELVDSTLAIGRIESGRDAVVIEPVPLRALWDELGSFCDRLPRKADVRIEWDVTVPGDTISTDPRKLTVMVRNLVGNALKFTERGRVSARLAVHGDQLTITVADTGIGIRKQDQATIFEMFRQADGSDSRRFGGSGLGLYIVDRYAQQLGGGVSVDSTPGQGSRFTIRLPYRLADEQRAAA